MINLREYLVKIDKSMIDLKECLKNPDITQEEKVEAENGLKTLKLAEDMTNNLLGNYDNGVVNLKEALATTDAIQLFPKIVEGKIIEAVEPKLLGTKFFDVINVPNSGGTVYTVPIIGELYAQEVSEAGTFNEQLVDRTTAEAKPLEVRVRKVGLKVSITEEAIKDSSWDILGINFKKMGTAMARYKEQMAFNNFTTHGQTVFDNSIKSDYPEAGTTGRDINGLFNDTLSIEDLVDIILAMMSNDKNPTDIIMHPLTWLIFARNSMIGNGMSFGAFGGSNVHPWGSVQGTPGFAGLAANGAGQQYVLTPEQTQNRLPMPININLSPFVRFDKETKLFDAYCVDSSSVGCIIQKEALNTGSWTDPERDIRSVKCFERYGMAIYGNGESISVARNIAADVSYPTPPVIKIQQ